MLPWCANHHNTYGVLCCLLTATWCTLPQSQTVWEVTKICFTFSTFYLVYLVMVELPQLVPQGGQEVGMSMCLPSQVTASLSVLSLYRYIEYILFIYYIANVFLHFYIIYIRLNVKHIVLTSSQSTKLVGT